jgi:hypothetical protein
MVGSGQRHVTLCETSQQRVWDVSSGDLGGQALRLLLSIKLMGVIHSKINSPQWGSSTDFHIITRAIVARSLFPTVEIATVDTWPGQQFLAGSYSHALAQAVCLWKLFKSPINGLKVLSKAVWNFLFTTVEEWGAWTPITPFAFLPVTPICYYSDVSAPYGGKIY